MKKTLAALVVLTCFSAINAQTSETKATGDAAGNTAASVDKNAIQLESGTRLAAQLQNSLDVRKVKVGDQVVLRTTEAIKSQGRTVVPKGAKLVGQVTEVAQRAGGNSASRIGLLFDRLERGDLLVPISATITSITSGAAHANAGNDDVFASSSASSSTQASASNPGVLGAVGGLVGSTTSTVGTVVGSTVDSTAGAAGSTVGNATKSLRGIRISESSSTSVSGGSTLSLQGGNIRLEKGTNFNLVLTQSASAGTHRNE